MTDDSSHPSSITMGRCQLAGTPRACVGENDIITGREANQSQDEFKLFSCDQMRHLKLSVCLRNKPHNFSTGDKIYVYFFAAWYQ
jgi:hypothetical protein